MDLRPLAVLALFVACALPACAQQVERTFYTAERVAQARQKVAQHEWASRQLQASRDACAWVLEMSDQELWDFVPPPEQARALNVHFGADCPVHGTEIHRAAANYPWIMSRDKPFKVQCPVGKEYYPSNDFQPWNTQGAQGKPETGPGYVDHGLGWADENGKRYWFVGYYIFWQRWRQDILPTIDQLAQAYLLTGEPQYARKCAVLLARIAADYERFDYPTQAYHNGRWPSGIRGRILDYIWETGTINGIARACDAVRPALAEDAELRAFLQTKGIADPWGHLETRMLHIMARDIMRGFIRGNAGMHQDALATVAIVLNNHDAQRGPTTEEMCDWLLRGGGEMEDLLWNGFYRDGHGGESSPGYSSGWCVHFYQTAALLERLGIDIWSNPKLKKLADIGLDLSVGGEFAPSIGDSGSLRGTRRLGWSRFLQGPAFRHYGDPRHAKALALLKAKDEDLWNDLVDEEGVAEVVAREGTDLGLSTRLLGGYGLAILESGEGEHRRGVSMYYGHAGGGHGHFDRLTLEMIAYGQPMLTEMGYPAHWAPKATYWTNNTTSHYGVLINETGQKTMYAGRLNTLASAPGLQLMDAAAEDVAYPDVASVYRRTTALIDISPERSYLLDLFRVQGGYQHDWSFHGPAFPEFTVDGMQPGPVQTKGTLAGEETAFGEIPRQHVAGGGISFALNDAQGLIDDTRPYADRSLEGWTLGSGGVLTRKLGAEMTFRLAKPLAGKVKLFLSVYDYNLGENELEVALGETRQTITWQPSGKVGYRWISQVFDLPNPAETLTITARGMGQSYFLMDGISIGRDLSQPAPTLSAPATSGFQYLFNVRRARPDAAWSATWRQPEDDLALTLRVPTGVASEVILADAEPELKPGNPRTLQYVLGRNRASEEAPPADGLKSTYIAVAEPHRGPAAVSAVERLRAENAPDWAEGILVRHGENTDLIHSSLNAGQACEWQTPFGSLRVTAEFALVTLGPGGVTRAYLVNGTHLALGDLELRGEPSPTGKVAAVDFANNRITLDTTVVEPAKNRFVFVGNERHQTSYAITGATTADGRTTLEFGDTLFVVGMGQITEVDAEAKAIGTSTQFSGYGRVDGGKHAGRWLFNEEKTHGFRIRDLRGNRFYLEGVEGDLDALFGDADGDGRRRFWISDIGPGDTFRIPTVISATRPR